VDAIVERRFDPDSKLDIDPVCGMTVYRSQAREHDLAITFAEREYFFCAPGCMKTFLQASKEYAIAGRDVP
jgi:YHS domain-containing protein